MPVKFWFFLSYLITTVSHQIRQRTPNFVLLLVHFTMKLVLHYYLKRNILIGENIIETFVYKVHTK